MFIKSFCFLARLSLLFFCLYNSTVLSTGESREQSLVSRIVSGESSDVVVRRNHWAAFTPEVQAALIEAVIDGPGTSGNAWKLFQAAVEAGKIISPIAIDGFWSFGLRNGFEKPVLKHAFRLLIAKNKAEFIHACLTRYCTRESYTAFLGIIIPLFFGTPELKQELLRECLVLRDVGFCSGESFEQFLTSLRMLISPSEPGLLGASASGYVAGAGSGVGSAGPADRVSSPSSGLDTDSISSGERRPVPEIRRHAFGPVEAAVADEGAADGAGAESDPSQSGSSVSYDGENPDAINYIDWELP